MTVTGAWYVVFISIFHVLRRFSREYSYFIANALHNKRLQYTGSPAPFSSRAGGTYVIPCLVGILTASWRRMGIHPLNSRAFAVFPVAVMSSGIGFQPIVTGTSKLYIMEPLIFAGGGGHIYHSVGRHRASDCGLLLFTSNVGCAYLTCYSPVFVQYP